MCWTSSKSRPKLEIPQDNPYLAIPGKLCSVYYENFLFFFVFDIYFFIRMSTAMSQSVMQFIRQRMTSKRTPGDGYKKCMMLLVFYPYVNKYEQCYDLFICVYPMLLVILCGLIILMGECKKDVTPLLTHWTYVFFLHQPNNIITELNSITK